MKKALMIFMAAMFAASVVQSATYTWTASAGGLFEDDANWSGTDPFSDNRNGNDTAFNSDATVVEIDTNGDPVDRDPDGSWSSNISAPGGTTMNVNSTILDFEYTRVGYVSSSESGILNLTGGSELQAGGGLSIGNLGAVGTVNVTHSSITPNSGGRIYIGYSGDAAMTLNGAASSVAIDSKELYLSYNENVDSTLTINDGVFDAHWGIYLGGNVNSDTGTSRIYLNGGELKANALFFNMADSKIVYTGGTLLIQTANVTSNDMANFISGGNIDVSGAASYVITTNDIEGVVYTYLMEGALKTYHYNGIRPTDPKGLAGLRNPERGFRTETQIAEGSNTTAKIFGPSDSVGHVVPPNPFFTDDRWALEAKLLEPHGVSLAQTYCYLTEHKDEPIPQSKLDLLQESFDRLRASGMKSVLRFAYAKNMDYTSSAGLSQILSHIGQLSPVIQTNSDVVFSMEAGLVGAWGEWHSDQYIAPDDYDARAQIVKELVDALPGSQAVQIRTPQARSNVLAQAIFSGQHAQYAERTGFCNGGFFAGQTDGGTWKESPYFADVGNPAFDAVTTESTNMLVGGELFWSNPGQMDGSAAADGLAVAERMRLHHYSLFSIDRSYSVYQGANYVIDQWMTNSLTKQELVSEKMPVSDGYFEDSFGVEVERTQFDYIRDHLGYRLELQEATYLSEVDAGATFTVDLELINRGFAAPYKPRNAYIVLIDMAGNLTSFDTGEDPRQWQPYAPGDANYTPLVHQLGINVTLPGGIVPGYYHLGLWLPDPSASIQLDPRYAIRLANRDTLWWKNSSGEYGVNLFNLIEVK